MENINPNNIKIGDVIEVEQAWEDEAGNYHDEYPTVTDMHEDGELELDFNDDKLNAFLKEAEFFAKDYKPEYKNSLEGEIV